MPYIVHDKDVIPTEQAQLCCPGGHPALADYRPPPDPLPCGWRGIFDSKADAVAARTGTDTITYLATHAESSTWRTRESNRFRPGNDLPNGEQYHEPCFPVVVSRHYAHVSRVKPDQIAYTPDQQWGHEGRTRRTTIARYLERYAAGQMTADERRAYCAMARGLDTLTITQDADTIVRVYAAKHAPDSCMSGLHFRADDPSHPCRVYAGPDLALAYLGMLDPDDPSKDAIAARAIVWPSERVYVRTYGDTAALAEALKIAGYERADHFRGARVRAIQHRHNDGWIMPYIDGAYSATRVGAYFVLHADEETGDLGTRTTNGLADERDFGTCAHCGDDLSRGESGNDYCDSCNDERWICDGCSEECFGGDGAHGHAYGVLCETCDDDAAHVCPVCAVEWHGYDVTRSIRRHAPLCPVCQETHAQCCAGCRTAEGEYVYHAFDEVCPRLVPPADHEATI